MTHTETPLSRWMLQIENAGLLDAGVGLVRPVVKAVTSNDTVRGLLQGRWLGHAAHPIVVVAPLGFWMSAGLLQASGLPDAERPVQVLTGAGILCALPAAMTGLAEIANADERGKRVGVVHATLNVAALGMQAASWLAGRRGRSGRSRLYSLGGLGLAGAGGYLGGHLSVARKVGSRDPVFTTAPAS